jgi:hypothetical protein
LLALITAGAVFEGGAFLLEDLFQPLLNVFKGGREVEAVELLAALLA